jgi:hypothetical protein
LNVGLLDHRCQRLLGSPARLQEGGEVAALPQFRDPQLDGADPGLPVAVAVAIPLDQPVGAALAGSGAGEIAHLQLHQALGGEADHLAQEGGVRALLQQLAEGDPVVGHRGRSEVRVAGLSNPTLPRITAVAASAAATACYTTTRDTTRELAKVELSRCI